MWAIREVLFFWKCCYIGLGFEESKLMGYKSYEEYDNLYSRGSGSCGIAAAFGDLRYAKVFLSEYCTKYTAGAPTFQTGGSGFVFPKGIAALSALIIFDSRASIWTRIRNLLGILFQRDSVYRISRQIERNDDHSGINLPEFVTPSPPVDSAYTELPGDPSLTEEDSSPPT
uniref:Uncharacterized protein n=1 Tax=Populus alba TaxID=43335 RepID=A0A4U5QKH6_POPAL|nr:hypothetical protein D5086_0000077950 [Populus alba]